MSKKVSLGVAATVTLIAMAVTFSMTMTVSMNMFNNTVSSVKNKERMYNKLSEVDRYVRANEYFDINDDTLNDTIASGYMLGISDRYARYYSAKTKNIRPCWLRSRRKTPCWRVSLPPGASPTPPKRLPCWQGRRNFPTPLC